LGVDDDVDGDVSEEEKDLDGKIIEFVKFLRRTYFPFNEAMYVNNYEDILNEFFDKDIGGGGGGCEYYLVMESYVRLCDFVRGNKHSIVTINPDIGKLLFLIYW
jgi:hypothetical protein